MPCIVITNQKGGVGKSTTSVILATELALMGYKAYILDCDPNKTVTRYAKACAKHNTGIPNVEVISDIDKSNITKTINSVRGSNTFVIVDLPGSSSVLTTRALANCDLVITPLKPQKIDAEIGVETTAVVQEEENELGRKIPHCFLINEANTSDFKTTEHRGVEHNLKKHDLDLLGPYLCKRVPYSNLMTYGGDLRNIPHHSGKVAAQIEAATVAVEVVTRLAASR